MDPARAPSAKPMCLDSPLPLMTVPRFLLTLVLWCFTQVGLAAPGDVDPGFDPNVTGLAGNTSVNAVAEQPDHKLVIGGSFTAVGGVPRNNLARLNPDGSSEAAFDPN